MLILKEFIYRLFRQLRRWVGWRRLSTYVILYVWFQWGHTTFLLELRTAIQQRLRDVLYLFDCFASKMWLSGLISACDRRLVLLTERLIGMFTASIVVKRHIITWHLFDLPGRCYFGRWTFQHEWFLPSMDPDWFWFCDLCFFWYIKKRIDTDLSLPICKDRLWQVVLSSNSLAFISMLWNQ